jgi:hypothetical protein
LTATPSALENQHAQQVRFVVKLGEEVSGGRRQLSLDVSAPEHATNVGQRVKPRELTFDARDEHGFPAYRRARRRKGDRGTHLRKVDYRREAANQAEFAEL